MIYIELFISFLKIGFTSFGGLSMIPLINSEMLNHGWMTAEEVADIVAIAEMTPGPLGLNCATFAGMQAAGILGALLSTLAILTPTLTLCIIVAFFFVKFKNSRRIQHLMIGVRPAGIGMIFGVSLSMLMTNYNVNGKLSPIALCIGLLDFVLLFRWKISVPKLILMNAGIGMIFFGFLGLY